MRSPAQAALFLAAVLFVFLATLPFLWDALYFPLLSLLGGSLRMDLRITAALLLLGAGFVLLDRLRGGA